MSESKGDLLNTLSQPDWQQIYKFLDSGLKSQLGAYVKALAEAGEEELRKKEKLTTKLSLFTKLVELAPVVLWISDEKGKIDFANNQWFEYTGATLEETLTDGWLNFIDEKDRRRIVQEWSQALRRGTYYESEYRVLRIDGVSRWCSVKAAPLRNDDGQISNWFGCTSDIHEQKMFKEELAKRVSELSEMNNEAETAKHKLVQSELMFRTMCEASPQILWTADATGQANYFNSLFYQYTGSTPKDCLGEGWINLTQQDNRERVLKEWHRSIDRAEQYEAEVTIRRADGEYRRHIIRGIPFKDDAGTTVRWFGTATDIETLSRLVSELGQARDRAESALAVKSEFVANVSHELRTPMNGILGMVEVLLRTQELTPKTREYVLTIKEAGDSLLGIINDLLDFSKVEAGKMEISHTDFDLISLVEGVGDILVPQSASKNILLLTSIDPRIPRRIIGDPLRLRQILLNLAGNAVKFTDAGIVIIKLSILKREKEHLKVRFSIIDSGIGIAAHLKEELFEPFMQANSSFNRSSSGTGLGLCISKRLAELMHGNLSMESEEGVGSTFTLDLVFAEVNAKQSVTISMPKSVPEIFILEPNSRYGFVIEDKLRTKGLEAKSYESGSELITALERAYDQTREKGLVVLLDEVRNPEAAAKFYQLLKNHELGQALPVLHLTGSEPDDQSLFEALDYELRMPLRRDELMEYFYHLEQMKDPIAAKPASSNPKVSRTRLPSISPVHIEAEKPHTTAKRVLVADDNKINLQVAQLLLSGLGLQVDTVADGIEAVSTFKDSPYDLVVLDCQMPILDGFESCRIIKEIQIRKGRRVPVIAMTAHAIAGSKENCLARGFDDYLSKPIVPDELERIIKFWLGLSDPKSQSAGSKPEPSTLAPERKSRVNFESTGDSSVVKSSNGNGAPAIDLVLLRSRFNDKNVHSLLGLFISSYEEEIEEFSNAALAADWTRLKARAHAFKGACSTICATMAAQLLAELETTAVSEDQGAKMALLESLTLELHKVASEAIAFNQSQ